MGYSRQEYWSGLPFSSPGDLSHPEIKRGSPALQVDSLPAEPPGNPALHPGIQHSVNLSLLGHTFESHCLGFWPRLTGLLCPLWLSVGQIPWIIASLTALLEKYLLCHPGSPAHFLTHVGIAVCTGSRDYSKASPEEAHVGHSLDLEAAKAETKCRPFQGRWDPFLVIFSIKRQPDPLSARNLDGQDVTDASRARAIVQMEQCFRLLLGVGSWESPLHMVPHKDALLYAEINNDQNHDYYYLLMDSIIRTRCQVLYVHEPT